MNRRGFMQMLLAGGGFALADKLWVPKKSYFFLGGGRRLSLSGLDVPSLKITTGELTWADAEGVVLYREIFEPPVLVRGNGVIDLNRRGDKLYVTNHGKKPVDVTIHTITVEEP